MHLSHTRQPNMQKQVYYTRVQKQRSSTYGLDGEVTAVMYFGQSACSQNYLAMYIQWNLYRHLWDQNNCPD